MKLSDSFLKGALAALTVSLIVAFFIPSLIQTAAFVLWGGVLMWLLAGRRVLEKGRAEKEGVSAEGVAILFFPWWLVWTKIFGIVFALGAWAYAYWLFVEWLRCCY